MSSINLSSIRSNGCLPFVLFALPALTLPALFLHPGGLTWVVLESVTSFFRNFLGGTSVAFDILREGNLTTFVVMLWIFLGIAAVHFVRSLNAKRKSHKNFGNDKKNRGNKTGKGGYGADTGSDKESQVGRKKTRNRKKQRGHNAKHRHASKSDTSLEDIKNFAEKKHTKSFDSNNSFNGSDLEENKQKHNRDSSSSTSSFASSTISRSDESPGDHFIENDVHISESLSKDQAAPEKNTFTDSSNVNQSKPELKPTSSTQSWADAVSSDDEEATSGASAKTKVPKKVKKGKKKEKKSHPLLSGNKFAAAGLDISIDSPSIEPTSKQGSVRLGVKKCNGARGTSKQEKGKSGKSRLSQEEVLYGRKEMAQNSLALEKSANADKPTLSTNGYTKDNTKSSRSNNNSSHENNSRKDLGRNAVNASGSSHVYRHDRSSQSSNTGNTKSIYEFSEQDKAIAQQIQLQQEILNQQKIQQEKLIEEMRQRYPEQMAQYEQQQFIVQQQHFIEQQQARLNMAIQSQLQQHQEQQSMGNASINNNDYMTLGADSNLGHQQGANINDINMMHDVNAVTSNNNVVNDMNLVGGIKGGDLQEAKSDVNASANPVTPAKEKGGTNNANGSLRQRNRSVFKAQELAFDMATSLFDD